MGYKTEFASRVNTLYKEVVAEKKAFEDARDIIDNYFNSLYNDINETLEVSGETFNFFEDNESYQITFHNSIFSINFSGTKIRVGVHTSGVGYDDELKLEENTYISQKYKHELSEELLDTYLKDAFDKILNLNLK